MPISLLTMEQDAICASAPHFAFTAPHSSPCVEQVNGSMLLCCTAPTLAPPLENDAAHSQGWRFAFYAVAVTSAAAALAILALGTDPTPRRPAAASGKVRQFTDARSLACMGRNRVEVWQGATSS